MKSAVPTKIRAAWLEQGCFNLGGLAEEERFTHAVRNKLDRFTGGSLSIKSWPGAGSFKHAFWWHEHAAPPSSLTPFLATVAVVVDVGRLPACASRRNWRTRSRPSVGPMT